MDEFKPEDELKPDPSDRRTGRSRQSSERSERTERGEPQINFDDIELDDTDDRRPTRAQKERNEEPEIEEEIDESEDAIRTKAHQWQLVLVRRRNRRNENWFAVY